MKAGRVALAGLLIAANAAAAEAPRKVDLAEILANPRAYEGQSVTICGWATNGFEDSNLTLTSERTIESLGDPDSGLGVVWCKGAPKQQKPAQSCVSGTIFAADPTFRDKSGSVEVTLDNSSTYPWRIRQACTP